MLAQVGRLEGASTGIAREVALGAHAGRGGVVPRDCLAGLEAL